MESTKYIYRKNDSTNKAYLVQLKNNRYTALKPLKNKFMRLGKMLKPFSNEEINEYMLSHFISNGLNDLNDTNNSNDINDTNNTNDSNR